MMNDTPRRSVIYSRTCLRRDFERWRKFIVDPRPPVPRSSHCRRSEYSWVIRASPTANKDESLLTCFRSQRATASPSRAERVQKTRRNTEEM
jgi:hypothetical protein